MEREERIYKLKKGSDMARWAVEEIEMLTNECAELRKLVDFNEQRKREAITALTLKLAAL